MHIEGLYVKIAISTRNNSFPALHNCKNAANEKLILILLQLNID